MICTIGQRHQPSIANTAMPGLKNVNAISMMIMIAGGMKKMNNLNPKKMKTLFERLKPEHILTLNDKADEFPYLVEAIKLELQQNHYITDLKYGTVIALESHFNIYKIGDFINLFEEHENLVS